MERITRGRRVTLILLLVCFSLCILGIWQHQWVISLVEGGGYWGLSGRDQEAGHYMVPGLGARKQAVLSNGGNVLDLAVAMLETETMRASSYAYGDGKKGDAANFGIF